MRRVTASERRARLGLRHHLAAESAAPDTVMLAERLVGLHASDPATVFLSARARIPELVVADVERQLYDQQVLCKHLAMRRTLFVFPAQLVPVVQSACTEAILAAERKRLAKAVEHGGIASDGAKWLERAERATLAALSEAGPATGAELARAVPALRAKISIGEARAWGREIGVAGRVFTILAAGRRITRGRPRGSWTSSQHRWSLATPPTEAPPAAAARAELVSRWLAAFGPGTVADLAWWTGLGVGAIRSALSSLRALEVDLDGEVGLVLPDDVEPVAAAAPWAAFLPSLDPTTMGWKHRGWYLGEHVHSLFDRNGNAGPTVWWDGRVVGGWSQRRDGEVAYRLLEDVGRDAEGLISEQAARLQGWLDGTVVRARFPTPLDRELR